jgi:hypothetical protein
VAAPKVDFDHLNITISQSDIENREIFVMGTRLPLTDLAKVGDIIHIPIPAGKYTITTAEERIAKIERELADAST